MPQVSGSESGRGDAKQPAPVTLDASEIDDFLRFVLFDIARRPKTLKIRECIRVARYLDWLVKGGVPKEVLRSGPKAVEGHRRRAQSAEERDKRWCAEQIADLLWGRVRRLDAHQAASNEEALSFLRLHAETHLANPFVGRAINLIQDFEVPAEELRPLAKPNLVSRSRAGFGTDPHLQDDLSERLFATDHALKRMGLRRTRKKIAAVLNEGKIQTSRRLKRDVAEQEWLPGEVHERVKTFEKRIKQQLSRVPAGRNLNDLVREVRDGMADKWIGEYKWARQVESMPKASRRSS
jgi:hypothetical protein